MEGTFPGKAGRYTSAIGNEKDSFLVGWIL